MIWPRTKPAYGARFNLLWSELLPPVRP